MIAGGRTLELAGSAGVWLALAAAAPPLPLSEQAARPAEHCGLQSTRGRPADLQVDAAGLSRHAGPAKEPQVPKRGLARRCCCAYSPQLARQQLQAVHVELCVCCWGPSKAADSTATAALSSLRTRGIDCRPLTLKLCRMKFQGRI